MQIQKLRGGGDLVSVTQMTRVCTFLFSDLPVITVLQGLLVQKTTNFAKHPVSLPSFISYCFFSPAYIVELLCDVSRIQYMYNSNDLMIGTL